MPILHTHFRRRYCCVLSTRTRTYIKKLGKSLQPRMRHGTKGTLATVEQLEHSKDQHSFDTTLKLYRTSKRTLPYNGGTTAGLTYSSAIC